MHSRHAITLSLILGAFALVFALSGLFFLEFSHVIMGRKVVLFYSGEDDPIKNVKPPRVISKIEGSNAVIAEIDSEGNTLRAIYSSSLLDTGGDFSLFAVPQEHYRGLIYVQAVPDAAKSILKIYPLDVETGKLQPSILNVEYDIYTLSENQEKVTITKAEATVTYDIATGKAVTQ